MVAAPVFVYIVPPSSSRKIPEFPEVDEIPLPWSLRGFVYAIYAENNKVKIGFSTDVAKRFCSLKTGSPVELVLAGAISGDLWLERSLHSLLDGDRWRNEWFNLSSKVQEAVDLIAAGDHWSLARWMNGVAEAA